MLTLLAEVAAEVPLVCVVDDVQWLDPESVVVLGFVARRLYAERVVLLLAVREPDGQVPALAGLPELAIGGLGDEAALELLASLTPGPLSPAVGARIVAGTGGNPLALVEVARELSPAQLAGAQVLPEPLHIERLFVCLSRGGATVGPGFAEVVRLLSSASFTGFVVVTAEKLFAVAAAEQEDEAVDVVAQLLDAVSGVAREGVQ